MPLTQDPTSARDATDRPDPATASALPATLPGGTPAGLPRGTPAHAPVGSPPDAPAKLILGLVAAQLGVCIAVFTPIVVTLALRVAQIVPEAERGAALGKVLSVGALLALVGNPLFGALSDRTTSRFGRRRPWLVGGMAVAAVGLTVVGLGSSVTTLLIGWAIAQLGCNAALCMVTACIPDLIPDHQRGRVSGMVGMMLSVSMVAGSFLAQLFTDDMALAFIVPAVVGVLGVCVLAAVMPDRPARAESVAPYSLREFLHSFWVNPRKNPDYSWNFASRFLVFVGIACVTSYQVYFLMDRLGVAETDVASKMFTTTLVTVGGVVVGSLAGGWLSDATGRRKPFVLASAFVIGVGLLLIATAGTFGMFLFAVAVFGFGEGLYLAVDVALAAAVLPDPQTAAKDMGVLNIANALPQSLVPMLAPFVLAIGGGGNYGALFLFGGIAAAVGAALVQLIRSVR
ncbi:MFS transporter [Streptomyces sp. H34-S4]|uniref:MFS transporter n=1 Tax=Streptomyces sp. H34-S4 TaxID=2996463 RepID=UPI002271953D|nr:MFS transporter [Streptomyces sp. H34-S4]MCY0933363.1 MFS transporter [Streptomyces sp. H34-S4]